MTTFLLLGKSDDGRISFDLFLANRNDEEHEHKQRHVLEVLSMFGNKRTNEKTQCSKYYQIKGVEME